MLSTVTNYFSLYFSTYSPYGKVFQTKVVKLNGVLHFTSFTNILDCDEVVLRFYKVGDILDP